MTDRPFSMLDVLLDAEPLSQVNFVHEYIQLVFQDLGISLYGPVTVSTRDCFLAKKDTGFCDVLCRLIGQRVTDTATAEGLFSAITFENGTTVSVSIRACDVIGPEAWLLADNKGFIVVGEVAP